MVSVAELHSLSSRGTGVDVGHGGVSVCLVQELKLGMTLLQMHWLADLKTQTTCCAHYVLGTEMP